MIWICSKLGLLLVVFTSAFGKQGKDSAQLKPASEKAKLRDWFFRLSLRNDLIKLKEDGQDYLPVVKLQTDDGEGEDFSILVEDHPHPNNICKSESTSNDKEMRFVMRGLDQEFMCTEIKKKIPDVPEERSMSEIDDERRGPKVNFIEGKNKVEEGETHVSEEQSDKALDDSEHRDGEPGTDEDIDQIISETTVEEARTSIGEHSVQEQSTTELIMNPNNLVETITSSSVEKESTTRQELKEPEVYAKVIDAKNETKTVGGLAPLIDHLNGVSSHQQFEDPFYAKTIQDLVKDFRKHNLSEASWDQDKLNTILDKIEELVTGDKADSSPVEVIEASEVKESDEWEMLNVDVKKLQQELETLPQNSSQVNPENQPDNATVISLGIVLQNLPESPEARMADSQSEGRVMDEKQNSGDSDSKDDRAATVEKVINELREFVDVAANTEKPDMRSADSDGDTRSKIITDVNATSSESVSSGNASTTEEPAQIETTEEPILNTTENTAGDSLNDSTVGDALNDSTVEEELNESTAGSELNDSTEGGELNDSTEVGALNDSTEGGELNDSTEEDELNDSTTVNLVSGGESAAQSLNDTDAYEDYGSKGLIDMLSSWKQKFFIILGCFIVSMVLFLIIIAVLIYKVQQNKPNPDATK